MRLIFILLFSVLSFGQSDFLSNSAANSNFYLLQRELATTYNPKTSSFSGNKYFYKRQKNATLELFDSDDPINVETNYNLLDQTFDINGQENTLKLLPHKIKKVTFDDRVFISVNGKFYESIEQNNNFSLLADTFLEAYIPDYQPGIQEKPDPRFRRNNSLFLYYKERFTYIERRKTFLISMFKNSKTKDINTFYKKNKISPRDDSELKMLFVEFFEYLNL